MKTMTDVEEMANPKQIRELSRGILSFAKWLISMLHLISWRMVFQEIVQDSLMFGESFSVEDGTFFPSGMAFFIKDIPNVDCLRI